MRVTAGAAASAGTGRLRLRASRTAAGPAGLVRVAGLELEALELLSGRLPESLALFCAAARAPAFSASRARFGSAPWLELRLSAEADWPVPDCWPVAAAGAGWPVADWWAGCWRSEEHTSELQSHSFIPYAVF